MADVVYLYDDSLAGLLCCVFESYVRHEVPQELLPEGTPVLFPSRQIVTNRENACRVWDGLRKHGEAADWVRDGWHSCVPNRAQMLFTFIRAAFRYGASVCRRNADVEVAPVLKAVLAARHEAHLFCGFVRFSDYQGVLAAQIEPKAMVLPLLADHFADRFANEVFLIHDMTHGEALFHEGAKTSICPIDALELESPGEEEVAWRRLWRTYYNTIAIEGRYNPKCRMTHMPKRFWKNMTEFQSEIITPKSEALGTPTIPELR